MRAAVVYESFFGHTRGIAVAIAEALQARADIDAVDIYEVGDAPPDLDVDLLVVGAPTHAWSMSRAGTRDDARQTAFGHGQQPASQGPGVREWLAQLVTVSAEQDDDGAADGAPHPHLAATFDTAVKVRFFPIGGAAKPEAKALSGKGFSIVAPPEHFFVADKEGPLVPGELDRAKAWAAALPTRKPTHA